MAYRVQIKASALRSLKKLEAMPRARLFVAGLWRIRVGNYRIVYRIREKELLVLVIKVGHRKDVYR